MRYFHSLRTIGTLASVAIALSLVVFPTFVFSADIQTSNPQEIKSLIMNGGYVVTKNGQIISEYNGNKQFIPASILKIATASAALHILTPQYRFKTKFYQNDKNDMLIQGFGDPFLISEEFEIILSNLKNAGVNKINTIFLDTGAFDLEKQTDGIGSSLNPYDAVNGALAANFNTVNIEIADNGDVGSAEPQTPTLPIMKKLAAKLPQGTHRINISNKQEDILIHYAQLFRAFQKKAFIPGNGNVIQQRLTSDFRLVYEHRSSISLSDAIRGLMLYSNNYIANQIFLVIGAEKYGSPANWKKGQRAVSEYLTTIVKLDQDTFFCEEGSGISRKNRLTPRTMIRILNAFKPNAHLLPQENNVLVKSGTLKNVYSYAGYFLKGNSPEPFVIILNQNKNTRKFLLKNLSSLFNTH